MNTTEPCKTCHWYSEGRCWNWLFLPYEDEIHKCWEAQKEDEKDGKKGSN